jgi:amidase
MALGGDQGGSIRMPASWCGIVGFKPTHGLVPYTGIFPIEMTLDHVGPMTQTVFDCAQLLEVPWYKLLVPVTDLNTLHLGDSWL